MKKRIIALLLSLVMLTSLLTPTALATEGEESGTAQEEVVKSNENERTDQPGETENGDAKDENQAPQQPTTGDEEQPTGQDEPKNEDETKGEDGRPGEEPKQPEQTGDDQPTEPEQGEETETPEEPEEPEFDAEAVYVQLMACETVKEMDAIAAELTEEQIAQFSDDQLAAIEARYAELKGEEPEEPEEDVVDNGIVNFTDVAPLVEVDTGVLACGILMAALLGATANAVPDAPARTDVDGVVTSKTSTRNDDGIYNIRMEAFVTGAKTTTTTETATPTDIVLVLDQSGSMGYCIDCGEKFTYNDWDDWDGECTAYREVGTAKDTADSDSDTYYFTNGEYARAYYCSRDAGWYTRSHSGIIFGIHKNNGTRLSDATLLYRKNHVHRLDALTEALNTFKANVEAQTTATVNHKIAVVGFADTTAKNSELLTGVTLSNGSVEEGGNSAYYYPNGKQSINGKAYGSITNAEYKNALQDMSTDSGRTSVANAIRALTADGGTYTDQGLTMAEKIFEQNPVSLDANGKPTRNRVVILFTDGDTDSKRDTTIDTAYNLKNNYNATVYTVGIFDGADASVPMQSNASDANKFMHYLSSNFKSAKKWNNAGTATYPQTGSYYLSAGDTTALNGIFEKISGEISDGGASVTLNRTTVVRDVVSKYFNAPTDFTEITVKTAAFDGYEADRVTRKWKDEEIFSDAAVEIKDNEVTVTNFDFSENYVGVDTKDGSETIRGKKLIIEFTVSPKDEFWGGNAVPTNDPDSGVYKDGAVVENFEYPRVDVPLKAPQVKGSTTNIYYGGDLPETDSLYRIENKPKDLDMMSFVEVDTSELAGLSNTVDTNATVTVTVSPKYEGSITGSTRGTAAVKINVFKPVITWQDSQIDLGETAKYEDNFVKVEWKHGTDEAKNEMGSAPTLVYEYDKAAAAFTQDTPVKVTVKLGTLDITSAVTFVHEDCTFKDCNFDAAKGQFIVHIKPFDLTITKAGRDPIDENQAFVFHVKSEDANVDMYVTIRFGSDSTTRNSVTIKDLKPGSYTVTEKTGWSWRYEVTDGASKTIKPENVGKTTPGQASVSFANSRTKNIYWLNGCSWAVNNWNNTEATKSPATPGKTN